MTEDSELPPEFKAALEALQANLMDILDRLGALLHKIAVSLGIDPLG